MPTKYTDVDFPQLHKAHMAGESAAAISKRVGIPRRTIAVKWNAVGLRQRAIKEASILHQSTLTKEQKAAKAKPAQDAVRGMVRSLDEMFKRALTHEQRPRPMTTSEIRVYDELVSIGPVTRERAVGPYNVDFAIEAHIAVECFGGHWHSSAHHTALHHKRIPYLLDAGFDVIVVWVKSGDKSAWARTLEETISDFQSARRQPSAPREYRVIWSTGEILHSRNSQDKDFAFINPFGNRRNRTNGRYERAR